MFQKGELYQENKLLMKIKLLYQPNDSTLIIVPSNRNQFIVFYPHDTFHVHFIDDNGTVFVLRTVFDKIHMIKTRIYYHFTIQEVTSYPNLRNEIHASHCYQALHYDATAYQQIEVTDTSKTQWKVKSSFPLLKGPLEIFYYVGKRKFSTIGEIHWENTQEPSQSEYYMYDFSIQKKEVI